LLEEGREGREQRGEQSGARGREGGGVATSAGRTWTPWGSGAGGVLAEWGRDLKAICAGRRGWIQAGSGAREGAAVGASREVWRVDELICLLLMSVLTRGVFSAETVWQRISGGTARVGRWGEVFEEAAIARRPGEVPGARENVARLAATAWGPAEVFVAEASGAREVVVRAATVCAAGRRDWAVYFLPETEWRRQCPPPRLLCPFPPSSPSQLLFHPYRPCLCPYRHRFWRRQTMFVGCLFCFSLGPVSLDPAVCPVPAAAAVCPVPAACPATDACPGQPVCRCSA